jgi:hypothetical protein
MAMQVVLSSGVPLFATFMTAVAVANKNFCAPFVSRKEYGWGVLATVLVGLFFDEAARVL